MRLKVLLFFTIAIYYFLPREVSFAVAFCIILLFPKKSYVISKRSLYILLPIAVLFLVGLLQSLHNNINDVLRDFLDILKIIVYFALGIFLTKYIKDFNYFYRYIKIMALICSLFHVFLFISYYASAQSLDQLRVLAGRGNLFETVYLAIFISRFFNKKLKVVFQRSGVTDKFIFILVNFSFLLYFSRSMIISVALYAAFLGNYLNIRTYKSKMKMAAFLAIFLIFLVPALTSVSSVSTNDPMSWLLSKFQNIPNEIFWNSKRNYYASLSEINENWRGYEAYQGMLKFNAGSWIDKIAGFGWGSLIDLGLTIPLGGKDFDKVPITHNGYVMLLVKSGVFGTTLYLIYLFNIGFKKIRNSNTTETYYYYQMLSALSLITVFNTFTITGLLNLDDAFTPIFLGLFWGLTKFSSNARYDGLETSDENDEKADHSSFAPLTLAPS